MNAQTETILTPEGRPFDWAAFHGYDKPAPARYNGWTADKQRLFLEAVSEGQSIVHACSIVGMSKQSAYALRNSARGAGFALGWNAAVLIGRNVLADVLMDRALHGYRESVMQDDGRTVTRHRHDNRLGMAMLTRLDKQADAARGAACDAAARLVAQDFEPYLDLIAKDAGPARAGLFLGARADAATPDDLEPVRALARADKWLRTHTDLAGEVDTADLDPAARADWTAEQWLRAEAAGLLVLAPPPPEPDPADAREGNGQLGQAGVDSKDRGPVWWCQRVDEWRTGFPPPDGFYGEELGEFGEEGYSRALTVEEAEVMDAPWRAEVAAREATETIERDEWFGFTPAPATDFDDDEDWNEAEDADEGDTPVEDACP